MHPGQLLPRQCHPAVDAADVADAVCHGAGQPPEPLLQHQSARYLYPARVQPVGPVRECGGRQLCRVPVFQQCRVCDLSPGGCHWSVDRHGNPAHHPRQCRLRRAAGEHLLGSGEGLLRGAGRGPDLCLCGAAVSRPDLYAGCLGDGQLCRGVRICGALPVLVGPPTADVGAVGRGQPRLGRLGPRCPTDCPVWRADAVQRYCHPCQTDPLPASGHNALAGGLLAVHQRQPAVQQL